MYSERVSRECNKISTSNLESKPWILVKYHAFFSINVFRLGFRKPETSFVRFWNICSCFTGNVESCDVIKRFQSRTCLILREEYGSSAPDFRDLVSWEEVGAASYDAIFNMKTGMAHTDITPWTWQWSLLSKVPAFNRLLSSHDLISFAYCCPLALTLLIG